MKSFLFKICAYRFFDDFVLIYPFYVLMMDEMGLSGWEISVAFITWSIVALALEVPSGVFADKYSRKKILIIGQIIRAIGYIIWMLIPGFIGIVIGFVLWGVKSALQSGTFDALVYDELKAQKKEKQYTKIMGKANAISMIGIVFADIIAAGVVIFGYDIVLILSSLSVLVAGGIIWFIPDVKRVHSTHEREYFSILKKGLHIAWKKKVILRFIIFISLFVALGGALDEYWPILEVEVGLSASGVAIYGGVLFAVYALANFVAHYFQKFRHSFFCLLIIISGAALFLSAFFMNYITLLLLFVFAFIWKVFENVYDARFQDIVPSSVRSTVLSVKGFGVEISALGVYLMYGILSKFFDIQGVYYVFAVLILMVGVYYLVWDLIRRSYFDIRR